MNKLSNTPTENELIEAAYAATLDPTRLGDFERFWEAYIDAQLQKSPSGINLDKMPVNAHISLALDILGRLKTVQEEENAAQHMVNSHYGFGFIVEDNGRIIVANDSAESFIRDKAHLKDLSLDETSNQDILSWMKKKHRLKKDRLKVFRVYLEDESEKAWLLSPVKFRSDAAKNSKRYFLITSVYTEENLELDPHIIEYFGLTPAEATVTGLLCNGMTPMEAAKERGVKIAAIRSQIVAIKEKTSARDIPDLIRIVTTVVIRSKAVQSQSSRMRRIRRAQEESVAREMNFRLRDGRNMQYFQQGLPYGDVILQIHSLISGVDFPDNHGWTLRHKYRMISPARAGYGKSDPILLNAGSDPMSLKSINARIDSCVDDLKQLLDHLGIEKVILFTGWAGAIAQRFALRYPDRCQKLILSGAVPVWEDRYLKSLQPRYRNMVKTSIHAPKAVPYLVRIAKLLIDSGRSRYFISDLDAEGTVDKAALKNNIVYQHVEKRFKFLLQQGVQAFVDDLPAIHTDWTEDARLLKLPVDIVIGRENKDQPFAAIERYKAAVPHAQLRIIEGAGTYQNLTHFTKVLDLPPAWQFT